MAKINTVFELEIATACFFTAAAVLSAINLHTTPGETFYSRPANAIAARSATYFARLFRVEFNGVFIQLHEKPIKMITQRELLPE